MIRARVAVSPSGRPCWCNDLPDQLLGVEADDHCDRQGNRGVEPVQTAAPRIRTAQLVELIAGFLLVLADTDP
jgi:hypothetical protein